MNTGRRFGPDEELKSPTGVKRNGPMIERRTDVSADSIRKDGASVAEHIRALAEQAKKEGEEVAAYAEEIATAITEASDQVAERIAEYMAKCQAARTSMNEHKDALVIIPPRLPAASTLPPPAEDAAMRAVANALDADEPPAFLKQGPRKQP